MNPIYRIWGFGHRHRRGVLLMAHFGLLVLILVLLALDPNGALS